MIFSSLLSIRSHPMRVRGLKLTTLRLTSIALAVAPHAGAWIETKAVLFATNLYKVAPHAGAWIETI